MLLAAPDPGKPSDALRRMIHFNYIPPTSYLSRNVK